MTCVTVTAAKPAVDAAIGLTLNYYDGGKIICRAILDHGIFHGTDLKAGMVLISVNDKEVKGLSTGEAMKLLTEAEDEVTVVAEDVGLRIVSFRKDEINSKVGIGLKERYGGIIVSSIADDGLLANTDIKVGHLLLGVNGTCCKGLKPHQAIQLFKGLDAITVLVLEFGLISVHVNKESLETRVGIGLKQIHDDIIVSSISPDGLFAGTDLKPGLRLLGVNRTDVEGLTKSKAIALFKNAVGPMTVLADDIGLVSVRVVKDAVDTKLGVAVNAINNKIIVSSIAGDSLFADTDLKEGMEIVCINNTMVKDMTKVDVISLFKELEGEVTVLAEQVGMICVSAKKESAESKIGIGLKYMRGSVVISSIAEGSLFAGTSLKIGHKLVSVNKVSCVGLTKVEAIDLLKKAEESITIMAEDIGLIGATVKKTSPDAKVGIGLKEANGEIYISSIYDSGLFANTDLREDLKLVSVNRTSTKGLNKNEAIELFKKAEGEITVMAMLP